MRTAHNAVLPPPTPAVIPPRYPLPVPKGCVLLYDFTDGGGKIIDHSPYHYDGAVTGATRTAAGRYFDGNDFIDTGLESLAGVNLFADAAHRFTVLLAGNIAGGGQTLIARAGATDNLRVFQLFTSSNTLAVYLRGTATLLTTNDTKAHLQGVIWDGSAAVLRTDGAAAAALNVGVAAEEAGQRIVVGARTNGTAGLLVGNVYWLEIYDRALSAAEYEERRQYIKAVLQARGVNLP